MSKKQNIPVCMLCEELSSAGQYPLHNDFQFKNYSYGDEKHWVEIHLAADIYNKSSTELFEKEFSTHREELPLRQLYVINKNTNDYIATATAWFDDDFQGMGRIGRVHWVAVKPGFQGLGIGKALMSKLFDRMKTLGHSKAYLMTSTGRIPAINLYLKFAFVPEILTDEERQAWENIQTSLKYPLPSQFNVRQSAKGQL